MAALARGLGRRGHSVLVNAPRASSSDYAQVGLDKRELDLGGNVVVRRRFSLPIPSSTRQSRFLLPTGGAARDTLRFEPDVIHAHTFLGAGLEALLAAARMERPLVGTNHWAVREFGFYVPLIPRMAGRAGLRVVTSFYNRCTFVTAPTASVLDEMRNFGLRRPYEVVSNPIDVELFRPAAEAEKRACKQLFGFGGETVLYAGRLAAEKNIDVLLRAFALIRLERPDAILALAGHGSAEAGLRVLAATGSDAQRPVFGNAGPRYARARHDGGRCIRDCEHFRDTEHGRAASHGCRPSCGGCALARAARNGWKPSRLLGCSWGRRGLRHEDRAPSRCPEPAVQHGQARSVPCSSIGHGADHRCLGKRLLQAVADHRSTKEAVA